MIFSCTKKVLDIVKKDRTVENSKEELGLHNWYVDLLKLGRKKYFIFTHSTTLYSFFVYAGTKKEIQSIEQIFEERLIKLVEKEIGMKEVDIKKTLLNEDKPRFIKTNSRSVLGSMNEFKFQVQYHFQADGGINPKKEERNYYLNEILISEGRGNYKKPIDMMKKVLDTRLKA